MRGPGRRLKEIWGFSDSFCRPAARRRVWMRSAGQIVFPAQGRAGVPGARRFSQKQARQELCQGGSHGPVHRGAFVHVVRETTRRRLCGRRESHAATAGRANTRPGLDLPSPSFCPVCVMRHSDWFRISTLEFWTCRPQAGPLRGDRHHHGNVHHPARCGRLNREVIFDQTPVRRQPQFQHNRRAIPGERGGFHHGE